MHTKPHRTKKSLGLILSLIIAVPATMMLVYVYLYSHLPDVNTLKNVQYQMPLSVYTSDGQLIAQYGEKRRTPVKLEDVPEKLIQAILATEDSRYYEHQGVDMRGLARAVVAVVTTGRKSQGASTITMQVARNFFLSSKKTFSRKINEMLLAIKIDATFSKDKILEMYLNKIYFGNRAYGVAAAAEVYYGLKLNELNLAQMAMIAGLPQAPSRDNPITNPEASMQRRNHVLARMYELGYINKKTYKETIKTPISTHYHGQPIKVKAPYVAEMVRAAMVDVYDDEAYTKGLKVYTTINSRIQNAANKAIISGLTSYDKKRGYRGPVDHWKVSDNVTIEDWQNNIKKLDVVNSSIPAVVLETSADSVKLIIHDGNIVELDSDGASWALQGTQKNIDNLLKQGDVIYIEKNKDAKWQLAQLPEVEGALVALNPNDGAVLALVGGYSTQKSHFNRVTKAERQPGSSFKPFVYSAALAKGFTLASVINDAPLVMSDNSENEFWRPQNSTRKFYGNTRLRVALSKSRNLVSIRLLRAIGISYAQEYIRRFGFSDAALPKTLTLALGSGSATPLQVASGFTIFANGGFKIKPYFIQRIENENGEKIHQEYPLTVCEECLTNDVIADEELFRNNVIPAPRIITPQNAFLITSALQDTIQSGTARKARVLGRSDLAGKTGTTNNQVDAWFTGYNSDIVATVWMGFDKPKSLNEYSSDSALPIWIDFMSVVLNGMPEHKLAQPGDLVSVRIDPKTGLLAHPEQKDAITEFFTQDTVPKEQSEAHSASISDDSTAQEIF